MSPKTALDITSKECTINTNYIFVIELAKNIYLLFIDVILYWLTNIKPSTTFQRKCFISYNWIRLCLFWFQWINKKTKHIFIQVFVFSDQFIYFSSELHNKDELFQMNLEWHIISLKTAYLQLYHREGRSSKFFIRGSVYRDF